MKFSAYTIFSILIVALISCSDDNCNEDTETKLKLEFNRIDSNNPSYYIKLLSLYSQEWTDSIHYEEEGSDNSIFFMLSPNSDTTEVIITSSNAPLNDTIWFYYKRELSILSPECGFVMDFEIDSLNFTKNYIDSANIVDYKISFNDDGHIEVYL